MANTQAMCTSFKVEILNGIHALGTSVVRGATTPDSFKAALYLTTATINAASTFYTVTVEVSGTGYVAGGVDLTGSPDWIAPTSSGTTAYTTPTASIGRAAPALTTAVNLATGLPQSTSARPSTRSRILAAAKTRPVVIAIVASPRIGRWASALLLLPSSPTMRTC